MIIENGFYVYMLIQLFLTHRSGREILFEHTDDNDDVLREFQEHKSPEFDDLLKDNILGELTKLSVQLMKHGVSTVRIFKKNIIDKALKSQEEL